MFTAKRVVFSGKDFFGAQFTRKLPLALTKSFEMWVVHAKRVDVLYLCRLASKNLDDLRMLP